MKKVLGLDLGSSSIGWALIHQPETESEKHHIAGMGVRIIPLSKDDADEFSKGNAISKNASRTLKRGVRRSMHRYKMRKQFLSAVFQALNMMPPKELFMLSAIELYGLRDKALKEQITLQELARIFFHLNQKRGYKSNRKANNEEESEAKDIKEDENIVDDNGPKRAKKKGYLDLINDREELIKEQTIGSYFYHELLKNPFYHIKENIFMRKSYENEFDQIWETQQQYYPYLLSETNKNRIRNEIIYYQRPLKSQKGLVSVCTFEGKMYADKRNGYQKEVFSGPKVVPKSSPLFQISKIWQELNNVEITSFQAMKSRNKNSLFSASETGFDQYCKRKLSQEEKQKLFDALNWGEKLTPKQILQNLGYSSGYNEYKINLRNEKFMEGNRTLADIKKVFDKHKVNRDELLSFDLKTDTTGNVDKETGEIFYRVKGKGKKENPLNTFENEPLYKLWHLIYSIEETETLVKTLQTKFNLSNEIALGLSKLDFQKAGYGNMSARALRNILPHLMNGLGYADACTKAGYNHSNSITSEENIKREIQDKLELYPKNSLRQPVVEKIINQVINLINELIDEKNGFVTNEERYSKDKFEIRIELARELKQSAGERNDAFSRNTQQDKRHKAIEEELRKCGFKRVSKNDIERYKLWEEFGKVSPYEPTKVISLSEVFNQVPGVLYDIEHIIPKTRLFDDSFSNKTICPRKLNKDKDNQTAYDFMNMQGEQVFHNYKEFIKQHLYKKDGISKSKFKKLMMSLSEIPDDFIDRQMNETRFISREIKGLLQKICRNVHSSTGTVTSKLRHLWGWDDVLMHLQIDKYREHELTEWIPYVSNGQSHKVEKIIGWSKREDQRHHAIDALSIACTKQGFVQRINSLNAQHTRDEMFNETRGRVYNEKLTLLEKYLADQKPFDTAIVQNEAAKILVSFKAGKRVAAKSINKIKKGNHIIEHRKSLTPRGFLHKETVYGQIKQFEKLKLSPRFNSSNEMINEAEKQQILEHLSKFDNDVKKAFNSKELINFIQTYGYNEVTVYKKEAVVKYKLNGDFKEKDIEFIVDKGVQKTVKDHLAKYNNNPKIAFNVDNTVWMNETKGIAVKSVRCKTGSDNLQPLHKNQYGVPIDFVSTRNNHHIAIYRDSDGKLQENAITFWDAFERKKAGLPVIIKEPKSVWDNILNSGFDEQHVLSKLPLENWEFITSLQQNEMFIFDLTNNELQTAIEENNLPLINKHLYRVQKIAESYYNFRHHLETSVDDKFNGVKNEGLSITIGKMKRIQSLQNMTGIKIKIDNLGRIIKVGE
jgi:CRISPR-associated endonuclease Csn1